MSDFYDDPDYFKLDWEPTTELQLGLISVVRGGQLFVRQAGGRAVIPCTTGGNYVPLRDECPEITNYFVENPLDLVGDSAGHLKFIRQRLDEYGLSKFIVVDERLLEAFTEVEIIELDPSWPANIRRGAGILTWPNSD